MAVSVPSPGEPLDQIIANWAAFAAAVGVFLGALIALVTIVTGRRASRREAVFRFLERQDTDRYAALFSWADGIIVIPAASGMTPALAFDRFEQLPPSQQDRIWGLFNFWEEVCMAYRQGLLDKWLFQEALAPLVIQAWQEARWLVDRLRVDPTGVYDPTLFVSWQKVYEKLEPLVAYTHEAGDARPRPTQRQREWRELFPPDNAP